MGVLCGVIIFFSLVYAVASGLSSLKYEKNIIGKIALLVVYFGVIIWLIKTLIL